MKGKRTKDGRDKDLGRPVDEIFIDSEEDVVDAKRPSLEEVVVEEIVTKVEETDGQKTDEGQMDQEVEVLTDEKTTKKKKKKRTTNETNRLIDRTKTVTEKLMDVLVFHDAKSEVLVDVMKVVTEYDRILMESFATIERLKGRLEVFEEYPMRKNPIQALTPASTVVASASTAGVSAGPPLAKPVDTYALVVKSREEDATSKEIVERVLQEVGPTLGVRVHEVRPTKGKGAIIRTPTEAERTKIATNKKFSEVGLEVNVVSKGPRLVVHGVHTNISPEEFMCELYENNLKPLMTLDECRKNVRIVGRPWVRTEAVGTTNVVLEGNDEVISTLNAAERVYVKWYSFRVRPYDVVQSCFKCLGFDHRIKDCRAKQQICSRCGGAGHKASTCSEAITCRNCAFMGKPCGHFMMSEVCPIFKAMLDRANSRH